MSSNKPSSYAELEREHRTLQKRYDRLQRKLSSMEVLQQQNSHVLQALMQDLESERLESERLLLNILPDSIAHRLKEIQGPISDEYQNATIMFADIVGFTKLSQQLEANQIVSWLNETYSKFDELTNQFNVEKIRTIGDNYMVAAGVPVPREDHAVVIAELALQMRDYIQALPLIGGQRVNFRIGINSGAVIGGVIGTHKFQYDIWGDAVNLASRMESHGEPGRIQISDTTYQLIKDYFVCEPRGQVKVKGHADLTCWFIEDRLSRSSRANSDLTND